MGIVTHPTICFPLLWASTFNVITPDSCLQLRLSTLLLFTLPFPSHLLSNPSKPFFFCLPFLAAVLLCFWFVEYITFPFLNQNPWFLHIARGAASARIASNFHLQNSSIAAGQTSLVEVLINSILYACVGTASLLHCKFTLIFLWQLIFWVRGDLLNRPKCLSLANGWLDQALSYSMSFARWTSLVY